MTNKTIDSKIKSHTIKACYDKKLKLIAYNDSPVSRMQEYDSINNIYELHFPKLQGFILEKLGGYQKI